MLRNHPNAQLGYFFILKHGTIKHYRQTLLDANSGFSHEHSVTVQGNESKTTLAHCSPSHSQPWDWARTNHKTFSIIKQRILKIKNCKTSGWELFGDRTEKFVPTKTVPGPLRTGHKTGWDTMAASRPESIVLFSPWVYVMWCDQQHTGREMF